jgi:endonuclease-3
VHNAIQAAVPAARRRALHVNLVVHGQRTCLPRTPRCSGCVLSVDCPKIAVPAAALRQRIT